MAYRNEALSNVWESLQGHSQVKVLAAAVGYLAAAALGIAWSQSADQLPAIWPANALLLAVLLRSPRSAWPVHVLAAICAGFVAHLAFARPLLPTLGATALNLAEVLVALALCLRLRVEAAPPTTLAQLLRLFVASAGLPPLVGMLAGAGVMAALGQTDLWPGWLAWWASRAMGMLLFLPLFLWISSAALRHLAEPREGAEVLLLLVATLALTGFVMTRSSPAALFLLLLPLLWAATRADSVWLAADIALVAVIAATLTALGLGPLAAGSGLSPVDSQLGLQLVLGAVSAPKLVISIILNQERHMRVALAASESRYRSIYNRSPARLFSIDDRGRIVSVSDAWLASMGEVREAVLGRDVTQFLSEETRPDAPRRLFPKPEQQPPPEPLELQLVDKAGVAQDVLLTVVTGGEPAGEEPQALIAVTDITARKEAEHRRVQQLLEETQRSNEELQRFAYIASHDLQEPLRMVSSFCNLLRERHGDRLDQEGIEFLDFAVDGALRMQELVKALLAWSRVQSRGRVLVPVESEAALRWALDQLQGLVRESGAEITHGPLPSVMGDASQLGQLFQNLLGNAIKFRSESPPRIEISALRDGALWRFEVRDNGIGIDERHRETIFQIFQRLHTRDKYPGTGIGLAICSRIVERHGGRLWLDSALGHGSTFCFSLNPVLAMENEQA